MKWAVRIVGGLVSLIVVFLIVTSATFDFMIHSGRYQSVVESARELTKETHDTVYFRGNWDFDMADMPGTNNICAKRLENGTLFVRILVKDGHRLGKSGLVYTESKNSSSKSIERSLDSHGCGEWTSKGKIWGSWWAIENNLG